MSAVLWIFGVIAALAEPAFGQSLPPDFALTPGEQATSVPAFAANAGCSECDGRYSRRADRLLHFARVREPGQAAQ
jgi:hypothetical protein